MMPGASSLILDLLSTLKPGSVMPVGVLIEAGRLFGVSDNNIRVTAARLLAAGRITRDERGAYRLGEKSQPVGSRVRSWRDLDRRTRAWKGEWIGVVADGGGRTQTRARTKALGLLGFAGLRRSLWIRPDNLAASLEDTRRELVALQLPDNDLVCTLGSLNEAEDARARSLWDVPALRRSYRTLHAEIMAGSERLQTLAPAEAMVESFLLGGRGLRLLVRDPLLPEQICPRAERDELLRAMREYDRLGRLAWADLLDAWGVPSLRAPLNGRIEARRRLAG